MDHSQLIRPGAHLGAEGRRCIPTLRIRRTAAGAWTVHRRRRTCATRTAMSGSLLWCLVQVLLPEPRRPRRRR